jgi:transposase
LTDGQWALVEPLLPAPRTGGRPEKYPRRSIVDGDPATCETMIRWAAINTMTSRIDRGEPATRQQRWHWPDES